MHKLRLQGRGSAQAKVLLMLLGKEDGHMYYAQKGLENSPTAVKVLEACATVEAAYSRLSLLASPSTLVELPAGFAAAEVADLERWGIKVTDGQAEISVELAKRLGLLTEEDCRRKRFHSWQFRGVLLTTRVEATLCKGMLLLNAKLSEGLRLRSSCIKIRWTHRCLPAR